MDRAHLFLSAFRAYTRYSPLRRGKSRLAALALRLARRWPIDLVAKSVDGRRFHLNTDEVADHGIYFLGEFEPNETVAVRALVRPGDVSIDIGANFGWYTTLLSQLVGPAGEVHAFEPVATIFGRLQASLALMGHPRNVRANMMAVSDRVGSATIFQFAGQPSGHCSLSAKRGEVVQRHECSTTTLDEYAAKLDVQFIKCDVEGAECLVLAGAKRLLERAVKPVWLIEITPLAAADYQCAPGDSFSALERAGYRFLRYTRSSWAWLPNSTWLNMGSTNLIAVNPELHRDRLTTLKIRDEASL
jgi:FkbM family methyltransferase